MAGKAMDLTGQRFGRLLVVQRDYSRERVHWICHCDCGKTKSVSAACLRSGSTRSCGCLHDEVSRKRNKWKKHGGSDTRLYHVWQSMKDRCYNENTAKYPNYGGRGIVVCDEWKNDFGAFQDWALPHGYNDGLTIDRIDANGPYSPDNCRWATQKEQQNNRTNNHLLTYNGKTQTLTQWAAETGINEMALSSRINKLHWSTERALTEPINRPK